MTQDGSKEDRQTMSRKTYKTIETPSGSAEIRKAGARLAKVFYHLQVRQETIVGELAAGQEDRPGRLDIAGEVTVSIANNIVTNYGKNGITCNEIGTACMISGNTVTGRGPVVLGDAAQNGIQIAWGATALVQGNTVSGNNYTPSIGRPVVCCTIRPTASAPPVTPSSTTSAISAISGRAEATLTPAHSLTSQT